MIYIFPSAIVALICAVGMWRLHDKTYDPTVAAPVVTTTTHRCQRKARDAVQLR